MKRLLISWVGANDLSAITSDKEGPIAATLNTETFDQLVLLYSYPKKDVKPYLDWLSQQTSVPIQAHAVKISSPVDFGDIYQVANAQLSILAKDPKHHLSILLSPGTPAMQAVWILLGNTRYPVTFYQATIEQGVKQVTIPFHIAAEFIPELSIQKGKQLQTLALSEVPVNAAFDNILTQNSRMQTLKSQANILAQRDVPILIDDETGTGKELFATAIHNASRRSQRKIVTLNCGAIPNELIDATLFGHTQGAFTGANTAKKGLLQEADGGTIFLDEFGELPKEAQVRLLRVLQNGEVTPVGATKTSKVDVRAIAATNRNLIDEVAAGRFREDLFYRIAVGVIHLPPLRHRGGDISLLSDVLLTNINRDAAAQTNTKDKKLSVKARKLILSHPWHGNIRELYSTLLRASLWAQQDSISEADIQDAQFHMPHTETGILGRALDKSLEIQDIMNEVAQHHISRALIESAGKKKQAAELLGLSSYQTLSNWIDKYNVK